VLTKLVGSLQRALGIQHWRTRKERRLILRMCFGDSAAVERTISGELARNPGISELEACQRVIRRYQRDNA
jgi:hypothetical protein